ncbi:hypothetical protein Bbu156a_E12 (plasmid) [Borreliella burgdorferi 156a]|nr:hypothetical protein Bbu156a_E12 [Borreliella burgdorferi 156a]
MPDSKKSFCISIKISALFSVILKIKSSLGDV